MGKIRTDLTYAYIKPENGMQNEEEILSMIEKGGFKILGSKIYHYTEDGAKKLYKEHEGKDFFGKLIPFTSSEPVRALILQKENAVEAWRKFIGSTKNPAEGTIRYKFQIPNDGHKNVVHGSDSNERVPIETLQVFPELSHLWE